MRLSEQRGSDASGIAWVENGDLEVFKQPVSPSKLVRLPGYHLCEGRFSQPGPLALLGHARMATSGVSEEDSNNQPMTRADLALVHNGVLANPDELWAAHSDPGSRRTDVDTEALLALIHDRCGTADPLATRVREVFGGIEGSASIGLLSVSSRTGVVATNTGSLYLMWSGDRQTLLFASERYFLETIRKGWREWNFQQPSQLASGTGLSFDLDTLACAEFTVEYGRMPFTPRHFAFDQTRVTAAIRDWGFLEYDEAALRHQTRCTRCLLPQSYPHIAFDADGVCNYCHHMQPTVVKGQSRDTLAALIEDYARDARDNNRPTTCILPLSGGRDSCYGAYVLCREFGLKPLTYTYDWGMITDLARRNIARVCARLGIENILVSADIARKIDHVRANVRAWLRKPDLGLIPLFMAGDKHFFSWVNRVKRQNGARLNIWMMSPLENADFKEGFAGVPPTWERERTDHLSHAAKFRMIAYYAKSFINNPAYINRSVFDTAMGFYSFYLEPRNDYYNMFDFLPWREDQVNETIRAEFNWENAADTPSTWRIGDGTAPFYNYIYTTVAGFSENDTFRSNQIRNGDLSREKGLELALRDNQPRIDGLQWYCDRLGLDLADTLRRINTIPKLYRP